LLHNDDEIHLACSGRCGELFGFDWKYEFNTTAAVLQSSRIIGEIRISKRRNVLDTASLLPQADSQMLLKQLKRLAELWQASLNWKG